MTTETTVEGARPAGAARLTTTIQLLRSRGIYMARFARLLNRLGLANTELAPEQNAQPINLLTVLEYSGLEDTLPVLWATEQPEEAVRISLLIVGHFNEEILLAIRQIAGGYDLAARAAIADLAGLAALAGGSTSPHLAAAAVASHDALTALPAAVAAGFSWEQWNAERSVARERMIARLAGIVQGYLLPDSEVTDV